MGFPDSVLTSDEAVVRHLHPHWKTLIVPVFWLVVCVAAVVAAGILLADSSLWAMAMAVIGAVGLAGVGVLSVWPLLCWRTTHYVLTNERVLVRTGVFARTGRDIPLSRVNDVSFTHGVVDRILGCGTLTIESAGERGQIVLTNIPDVARVQNTVYELVEADRDSHSPEDGQGTVRPSR